MRRLTFGSAVRASWVGKKHMETQVDPQDQARLEIKKFEYEMAQEMLKHYDSLNWQIGSILIAGVLVLTGLAIDKDLVDLMRLSLPIGLVIALGVPALSLIILGAWWFWFHRHRQLYNYRNEVLQSIEFQLHMFHYLKVAQAVIQGDLKANKRKEKLAWLREARVSARYDAAATNSSNEELGGHWPLFAENVKLTGLSGAKLAGILALVIPTLQLVVLLLLLIFARRYPLAIING